MFFIKDLYQKIENTDGTICFVPVTEVSTDPEKLVVLDKQRLGACSERIKQALLIFLEMKTQDLNFNEAAKEVASKLSLQPSTVKDKVTRQLEMKTKEFEILIEDFISGRNSNFKKVLKEKVVNVKADTDAIDFFL